MTDQRSAIERFRVALDLWATGLALRRQAIRRQHPEASDAEVDRLLNQWLHDRPGAELGDGPAP